MQKISRAGDNLWVVSAFDPRKPVDPDWASRPPEPILRSGDEEGIFSDSPYEHHQGTDAMSEYPESRGADESELGNFFDTQGPEYFNGIRAEVPIPDLTTIYQYRQHLRRSGLGNLVGSDPAGPMVQEHPHSNISHYYTYNPAGDEANPWHLSTTHWQLDEPLISRHPSFENAIHNAAIHKSYINGLGIE